MAARLGLEPRQAESESAVLPLHHQAVAGTKRARRFGESAARWSRRLDSNPQPPVYKTGALPLSYTGKVRHAHEEEGYKKRKLVAPRGLEPRTY